MSTGTVAGFQPTAGLALQPPDLPIREPSLFLRAPYNGALSEAWLVVISVGLPDSRLRYASQYPSCSDLKCKRAGNHAGNYHFRRGDLARAEHNT